MQVSGVCGQENENRRRAEKGGREGGEGEGEADRELEWGDDLYLETRKDEN